MEPFSSFFTAALPWQNFYLLVGTAAATLIGLMVVAITFGAHLVTPETMATARAFVDPPFTHFVQVLFTAALFLVPSMSPVLIGALMLAVAVVRSIALIKIGKHMRIAHARAGDIELSDWITGIVIPAFCYAALLASGAAFVARYTIAFELLAGVAIVILLSGVYGAWETMLWMALARTRKAE